MAKDLTVILEDHPGTLAKMGDTLGGAGINIDGICAVKFEGVGVIHILVEDPAAARKALQEAGLETGVEREVLVLDIVDRPGELGGIAKRLASAGVNLDLLYLTASLDLVLGVDDLKEAQAAL